MFSTRTISHKISIIYEKELRSALHDKNSTFKDMQSKSNYITIYAEIIQKLMTAFYKYLPSLSSFVVEEVTTKRVLEYNLQSCRKTLM